MASEFDIVVLFVIWAKKKAAENAEAGGAAPAKPIDVLENLITTRMESELTEGKALISTTEANGTATFSFIDGLSPLDVSNIARHTIMHILKGTFGPDPDNPDPYLPKQPKRLTVSFKGARVS